MSGTAALSRNYFKHLRQPAPADNLEGTIFMLAHTNEAQLSTRGIPAARSGRKRKYALASIGITTVAALAAGITVGPVANAATSKAKGKPIKVGSIASLTGGPSFPGPGATHQPNFSSRYVQLKNGVWEPITKEWTSLKG